MGFLSRCLGSFSNSNHTDSPSSSTLIQDLCRRFSLAQLQTATNNFDNTRLIWSLGLSNVHRGCIDDGAYQVAIRRSLDKSSNAFSEFRNEAQLLCQFRPRNLISFIGFSDENDERLLVYEYMPNGCLSDHLYDNDDKNSIIEPLSWKKRLEIRLGAARGLHFLHTGAKRPIFHSDVRPRSILLGQNWVPKVADFWLSLKGPFSTSKSNPVKPIIATYEYVAPEHTPSRTFSDKCDVHSFGMLLLEVLCAKTPATIIYRVGNVENHVVGKIEYSEEFSFMNLAKQVCDLVNKGKANVIIDPMLMGKIAPECWKVFMEITERCLLEDPNEQPAMGEVEVELKCAL